MYIYIYRHPVDTYQRDPTKLMIDQLDCGHATWETPSFEPQVILHSEYPPWKGYFHKLFYWYTGKFPASLLENRTCHSMSKCHRKFPINTPPKFNSSPLKNGGCKDYFPIGKVIFQGRALKRREGNHSLYLCLRVSGYPRCSWLPNSSGPKSLANGHASGCRL